MMNGAEEGPPLFANGSADPPPNARGAKFAFRPGTKAAFVIDQGLDADADTVILQAKRAGFAVSRSHVFQIRSTYRAKLGIQNPPGKKFMHPSQEKPRARGRIKGSKNRPKHEVHTAPATAVLARTQHTPTQTADGLSAMERDLLRLAMDIGFGRAASLIDHFRTQTSKLIGGKLG
jgi:hypothetical protein